MKNYNEKLAVRYVWKILTDDGRLLEPVDEWGESHGLSGCYSTKEEAVSEYTRYTENGWDCPHFMVLIEEYRRVIDWGNDE